MLRGFKRQPAALLIALVVVPSVWNVPADILYDRLIPEETLVSGTVPLWLDLALLSACTIWSCVLCAGQIQIAIDSARGSRVRWQRFHQGVPHGLRIAVTALPFVLPLIGVLVLPEGDWLDAWALPLLLVAAISAVTLTARTILWAPFAIDGRMSLRSSLTISWTTTRAQTWRLLRLGLTLAVPLIPLFILEEVVFGESWVAWGLLGGLYTSASAHLYLLVQSNREFAASSSASAASGIASKAEADLPLTGSGWSRPFE
jgi:hypothetical protein